MVLRSYELQEAAWEAGAREEQLLDPPVGDRLGEIRCPTLVLVGDEDVVDMREIAAHVASSVGDGRLVTVSGAAHLPSLERAAEVNALLLSFLGRVRMPVGVRIDDSLDGVDWARAKADLAADDFDNGRSPDALRRSFEQSQHVAIARDGDRVVGMARLLSDGVCNAYLIDVWTASSAPAAGNRVGDGRAAGRRVPGQHIGLQTDDAAGALRVARVPAAAGVLVAGRRPLARQRRQSRMRAANRCQTPFAVKA